MIHHSCDHDTLRHRGTEEEFFSVSMQVSAGTNNSLPY